MDSAREAGRSGRRAALTRPEADEVHVWLAPVTRRLVAAGVAVICPSERYRAARFHRRADRDRYIAARGLARHTLARYLGEPAGDICLVVEHRGKPRLAAGELAFSVTHADCLVALAVTGEEAVGIDVERVNASSDWRRIATRHFHPSEVADTAAACREDLAALWTRKEAALKTTGAGLPGGLDTVRPVMQRRPTWTVDISETGDHLSGEDLVLPAPFVGSVCWTGERRRVLVAGASA